MANWKEKGVVPDSDDEDGLDSQGTIGSEDINDEPLLEELPEVDDIARATNEGQNDVRSMSPVAAVGEPEANILHTLLPLGELDESFEDALESHIEDDVESQSSPLTSPLTSPATATDPWANSDSGGEETIPPGGNASNSQSENLAPAKDDISKSYVQITSPTSTRLSSPPSIEATRSHTSLSSQRVPSHSPSSQPQGPNDALPTLVHNFLEPLHEPTTTVKRSFRRRNPIQLHPYIVEQEKYRKALKARGLAPTRLESSQEDSRPRNRNDASPDLESQGEEPQGRNVDWGESERVDMDWDPPSSSPVRSTETLQDGEILVDDPASGADHDGQNDDEDEEFPAIGKLLQGPPRKMYKKHEPKKRLLKTYSTRFRRPRISKIQTQTVEPTDRNASAISIYDVPASPPATSSPFTAHSRNDLNSLARAGSSSKEPTPSITLDEDDPFMQPGDLPTPSTSAVKPISLSRDSDLDSGDAFAHGLDKLPSTSSSSSDESEKIRKISRKIRGVLPASHLRLDHESKTNPTKPAIRGYRDTESASPVKDAARRGVALPRIRRNSHSPPPSTTTRLAFLSDTEEDDEDDTTGFIMEDDHNELESIFDQSRFGFAQEEDRIDAMLPSKKRTMTGPAKPNKKRKGRSGVGLRIGSGSYKQPRLTDHVIKVQSHISFNKTMGRSQSYSGASGRKSSSSSRPRMAAPPNLSILDVVDTAKRGRSSLPQFIRVAARTARSKVGQGRQSPSRKFIKLANREDTQDAQSVLQNWKQGMIVSRVLLPQPSTFSGVSRSALQEVTGNRQSSVPSYPRQNSSHQLVRPTAGAKRKLIIARHQQSINDFVTKDGPAPAEATRPRQGIVSKKSSNSRSRHYPARPAQLESSAIPYSDRQYTSQFKSRKRILDTLYRSTRTRPIQQPNLQLSRFLADDDILRPSVETGTDSNVADAEEDDVEEVDVVQVPRLSTRRRKQAPRRVDAGAANYRQPTDPLILDFFTPVDGSYAADDKSKLAGLGKFGTNYPLHFDIHPLQSGIFFHESTLIGGRRLSEAIYGSCSSSGALSESPATLKFAGKCFAWRTWDERVSSEVGVCFDWLLDQFLVAPTPSPPTADAIEVIMFVLDYVQYNVRFDGLLDRDDFMARMAEVMQDFSTRLNAKQNLHLSHERRAIEVLSTCSLIVLSLLNSTRIQSARNTTSFDIEDLLKSIAGHCVDLLLSHGLGAIRKLYDDLQYLSIREGGIMGVQYAANAWVTLIKVLDAAQICRGSFWDITNVRLVDMPMKGVIDAPAMEKIWYSLHTLLPLCEFDEFGVIVPGLRQKAKFDNWPLPQQILKQVFALYKSNQRQSPGFNDYCRALFHRCYHLMTEWGWWKCPSIVGTLFDFFASHGLAHLRNEEVYASPRFLEQLDTEPSLTIETEDPCFHIFLKIVALGIQHLAKADDIKSIRNLVARLLPNHDRQYPKDEAIHQRDLAALRNHHDLLCTIFWASPASQRPPVSLIQELVIAERSHNEACLINIRAWENLTRFIVSKSAAIEYYKPFTIWQSAFFSGLCQQYLDAENEVRQQAEALEHRTGQVMSEARIADTVLANRRSLIIPMCTSVTAMGHIIESARSSSMAKEALNCDVLTKALSPGIHINGALSNSLIGEYVVSLCRYMDQINTFHPLASQDAAHTGDEYDSQDSLGMTWNWERIEMVIPLRHSVLDSLCPMVRKYLESDIAVPCDDNKLVTSLVTCWARIVSLVSEEGAIPLEAFLIRGQHAVFENRQFFKAAKSLWPLFLATLLRNGKTLSDFRIHGFVIASEWLLGLANCQSISEHQKAFTTEMQKNGHYLCKTINTGLDHIPMMRGIINSILVDNLSDLEVGLSQKKAQNIFADILGKLMDSVQKFLESLEPGSDLHTYHLKFARVVVADIRSYAEFVKIPDFFLKSSSHFWPCYGDPAMFGAGLISYCLKLAQQSDRVSQQLFHYLFNGWKSAIVSTRLDSYTSCIRKGMKWWEFTKFMLAELLPAFIVTGFKSSGWLLCSTFLPAITKRVVRILENTDSKSSWVFENLLNILKMVMNGAIVLARQFNYRLNGVHPNHRGILSVTFKFWMAIALPMRQYAIRHSQEDALEEVTDPLSSFIYSALHTFHTSEPNVYHPDGQFDVHQGKCTDAFAANVTQDIQESWDFQDEEGFEVVVRGRAQECSAVQEVGETLGRVLEVDIERYECAYPNKEAISLPVRRNVFLGDLYV
ncbi:Mus7/MMS22 family protein [Diplocarpon rosae]|nr:Mus7/MMS22 family protein [Diplocarpon rosae]